MRVSLRLFAVARQRAGRPEITLDLPEPANVGDLRRAVAAAVPELEPLLPSLLIAVDNEYAADDQPIGPGSELAAIPPVSGGAPAHLPTLLERLHAHYPDARYELDWETPLQLLVATILAAQCTDERVNAVTRTLFPKYPDARSFADADPADLEEDVRPTGFYKNKARAIRDACRVLVDRFGGEVPASMEGMLQLPGVARKTANVVLTNAFRIPSGVVVDTHVARVSQRLGLSGQDKPERIEQDLMRLLPQAEWIQFGSALVLHGRYTCTAKKPKCDDCRLGDICPRHGLS